MTNLKHDGLFKKIMEQPLAAREFLECYLPADVKELVDLSTIKPEKDSFVDEDLRRNFSDVVFSIKTKDEGEQAFIYCIIEHQSTADYWMSLRLFKYVLLLAERYKTNQDKLPLIVPFIVYNGNTDYNAPKSLWQLFTNPTQAKALMGDEYRLVDLHAMTNDEIKQKQYLGMLEYFLKHIHIRDKLKLWDSFLTEFKEMIFIDKQNEYFYIKHFLWYTNAKVSEEQQQELNLLLAKHLSTTEQEQIMRTIAQKYIDEGISKGFSQGISQGVSKGISQGFSQGIEKTAINMLKQGFEVRIIAQITGLSIQDIQKLKASN